MLNSVKHWAAAAALTLIIAASAWAAVDVTGKWTWMQRGQNGNEVPVTLELKQDGEKLTGTYTRMDVKTEISEGKIKDNELSFVVVREVNGNQFKLNYKGNLEGDTIKGNLVININGEDRTLDWVANKAKS